MCVSVYVQKKEGACSKTPGLEKARKGIVQGHLVRRGGRCCSRRRRRTGKRAGVRAPWGFINGVRIRRCLPRRACACTWRDDSVRAAWRAGRTGGRGVGHFHKPAHPSIHPPSSHIPNAASPPARLRRYLVKNGGGAEGREGRGPSLACFPKNSGAIARAPPAISSPSSCMTGQDRPMQREARALLQWDGSPELAEVDGAPGKPLGDALKRDTSSTGCAGVGSLGQPGRRGGGCLSWTTSTAPHGPRFA